MNYEIIHNEPEHSFEVIIEGHKALVQYRIEENSLNIYRTYVPKELEGRGIAAALVKKAYGYADTLHLIRKGDCSYAQAWLKRNEK